MFVEEESKAKKEPMRKLVVYSKDITSLIKKISDNRSKTPLDALIRVGRDGGGGFLKICLSVFDINEPISCSSALEKQYLDSGVKKVQVLAVATDVDENYFNMKILWLEARIDKLPYKFTITTDLKLINYSSWSSKPFMYASMLLV